jgi:steroid delta-isomerase-like uncharacterized protein
MARAMATIAPARKADGRATQATNPKTIGLGSGRFIGITVGSDPAGCTLGSSPPQEGTMDLEATVRRLYDLINAGDIDGFASLLADDVVEHEVMPGLEPTKDGVTTLFKMQLAAFPDMKMHVEDVFTSGKKGVARVRYTGTHQADFMGMPATGKSVDVQLIDIFLFGEDGLVNEHWGVMDSMLMMQQLGLAPAGPPA